MTPAEFSTALASTRLKPRAAIYTRRVLVDGLTQAEAAREAGTTRQAVSQALRALEAAHKYLVGCPPGWRCITVCVPPGSLQEVLVRDAEEDAWRAAGLLT